MDIISYRGPGNAGGVSTGIAGAWRESGDAGQWFFIEDGAIRKASKHGSRDRVGETIDATMIDQHYRYCNEFLWPIMHDLPQHARYIPHQRAAFNVVNARIAEAVQNSAGRQVFVQDYQFSLLARSLPTSTQSLIFWHIPWPAQVATEHAAALIDVAKGLLCHEVIGFHTKEYASNFLRFVDRHIDGCDVDYLRRTVEKNGLRRRTTQITVQPLAINSQLWHQLALRTPSIEIPTGKYVLSVDRADYSKSILDRLNLIERFFSEHAEFIGRVQFVQVCTRTREGLPAFDNYWSECHRAFEALTQRLRTPDWQPVIWIKQPLGAQDLASLYRHAAAMLITPIRDGLNLTAKEFVACQLFNPGVLLLSPGAGAWHELSDGALSASPLYLSTIENLKRALEMDVTERHTRMCILKKQLAKNSLSQWWHKFTNWQQETSSKLA